MSVNRYFLIDDNPGRFWSYKIDVCSVKAVVEFTASFCRFHQHFMRNLLCKSALRRFLALHFFSQRISVQKNISAKEYQRKSCLLNVDDID